jgi:hypothetical protein
VRGRRAVRCYPGGIFPAGGVGLDWYRALINACAVWMAILAPHIHAAELSGGYYVFDGRNLQRVERADPDQVHVDEWQVWLYKKGSIEFCVG